MTGVAARIRENLRQEFRPMLRLAAPLALAELGWMSMGIVDTIMAGRLGAAAVGAGSLGNMLFYPLAGSGAGALFGMDTLVAQSHGAEDARDCRRTLVNGVFLSAAMTPPLMAALLGTVPVLRRVGTNPTILELLIPYLWALSTGTFMLLLYMALRRYLQAVNVVRPVTFALVSSNLINVAGNYALMYGHWGAPAMGLEGSGWSTSISRVYLAGVLAATVVWHERKTGGLLWRIPWRPDRARIAHLLRLGAPAAGQMLFEGALFSVVTTMAAKLDEVSLAAHSIAVQVIATTYMVPLGISSAAAVRVGQAVGRKDRAGAARAGWTALLLSAMVMGSAGLALGIVPRWIVRIFIGDAQVIASGAVLLRIAALFQLFDGFQVTATGSLRGVGDTRTPMLAHLGFYWLVGLPVAYVLCFNAGWGVRGIWVGLTAALILIGAALMGEWARKSRPRL